ncbi:unnamed protein product [Symbiodinium natans]|uniref:Uncharacterized protein n=1 Tax=Symbiodinium natans TaxID=878477 RepID=A0A812PF77_9DINO|nr:unnamed protein product [Symbiodinium natans]
MMGAWSVHPLLGSARLELTISCNVTGLYIGVKEPRGSRQTFVRATNLHRSDITWAFGVSDRPIIPHFAASCHGIQAGARHTLDVRWTDRLFRLCKDGQTIIAGLPVDSMARAAPTFANVYIWAFGQRQLRQDDLVVTPLPAGINRDAAIRCSLCRGTRGVVSQLWAICPRCHNWICRSHVEHTPFRLCDVCGLAELDDFVGGSHVSAREFWHELQAGLTDGEEDKWQQVVRGILVPHSECLAELPHLVDLVPAPQERMAMSKRRWERLLYRARTLLDMLDQRQHLLLFQFMHALARKVPERQRDFIAGLLHPAEFQGGLEEWRLEASLVAVQLQVVIGGLERGRSQQQRAPDQNLLGGGERDDYMGGAQHPHLSAREFDEDVLGGGEITNDILRAIPSFFDDYDDIYCLACCCCELRDIVLDRNYWRGKHINLVVPPLTNAPEAVRSAAKFFDQAASLTMEIPQLVHLDRVPRRGIIHWYSERLENFLGNEFTGWESKHPLFGAVRFSLTMPLTVASVYIGAKALASAQRSFIRITNPYTSSCELSAGLSGTPVQPFPSNVVNSTLNPPGFANEFYFVWSTHRTTLYINQQKVGTARLEPGFADMPGAFSSTFVWVISRRSAPEKPTLTPLLSPIDPETLARCCVCGHEESISSRDWLVCWECCSWACRYHAQRGPREPCPTCGLVQLADCLGGSTGSSLDASQKRRLQESRLAAYERKATRLASMEGFLPKLLQPSAWTCPSTPSAFEPGNAADVDVLKTLRAHPRDFAIRFQASDHTYYIEGVQTHGSVTSMIHAFSEPFQPDLVIAKMMQGRNWPRAGYLKRDVSFAVMTRLRILCPGLLDLYAGNPRDDVSICNVLRGVSDYADISHEITQLSLSPQEIKVGQEVVEDDESRADARLVARENTFRVPDEVEIELEHHLEDSLDLDLVFACNQAAIALAKRGENIVRCFIGVSPGGATGTGLAKASVDCGWL